MMPPPWPLISPARSSEAGATRVIWPSDVIDRKNLIQAKMVSVGGDVDACKALPAADAASWAQFYAAWRQFFCRNTTGVCAAPDYGLFDLGGQYDDLETWDANLYAWQQKLQAAGCNLSSPAIAPPTPTGQQGPGDLGVIADIVKWGAIGIGAYFALQVVGLFPKAKR